jgi:hypothetical protein
MSLTLARLDVAFCGAKTKAHRDPSGLYMRKIPMKITPICLTMSSGSIYLSAFLSLTHIPIPIEKVHCRAIEAVLKQNPHAASLSSNSHEFSDRWDPCVPRAFGEDLKRSRCGVFREIGPG